MTIVADAASVDLKNLDTKSVEVETDVGSISLDDVQGNVQATSDVGGISGEMDVIDDDWTLISNVGKIALRVGAANHTSFIANTDVGSVRIFGDNKSYVNKNQKTVVEMKTDVGSINVKRKD